MKEEKMKPAPSGKENAQEEEHQTPAAGESEGECRCKEVSKKSLPELIRIMLGDLAFWRKNGKG